MEWISTLRGMKKHETIIRASCQVPACKDWYDIPADELIGLYGEGANLRDVNHSCRACGGEVLFLASPSRGTPFRPVL